MVLHRKKCYCSWLEVKSHVNGKWKEMNGNGRKMNGNEGNNERPVNSYRAWLNVLVRDPDSTLTLVHWMCWLYCWPADCIVYGRKMNGNERKWKQWATLRYINTKQGPTDLVDLVDLVGGVINPLLALLKHLYINLYNTFNTSNTEDFFSTS